MSSDYVRVKSLALFTGSPTLIGFINYLNIIQVSEEVFKFVRRVIEKNIQIDKFEMENNIRICITLRHHFFEVSISSFLLSLF